MRYAFGVAGRVVRDSFWRPVLSLYKAGRMALPLIALAGLTAYQIGARDWLSRLSPLAWATIFGWIAWALFFFRACRLQVADDLARERLGLLRDRQSIIDMIDRFQRQGSDVLGLRVTEASGAVEAVMRRWVKDVHEYLWDKLGSDRGMAFNAAVAASSSRITPGCPAERARQILQLQGKVDYLAGLSQRLAEMGLPKAGGDGV